MCFIRRLSGCESDSLLAAWAVTGRACPRCLWGFRDTHPSRNSLTGCVTPHTALDYRAIGRTPVTPRTRRGSRTHKPFRALRSEHSASANSARRAWWESHTARCVSAAVAALPLLGGVVFCQTRRTVPVPVSLLAIVCVASFKTCGVLRVRALTRVASRYFEPNLYKVASSRSV